MPDYLDSSKILHIFAANLKNYKIMATLTNEQIEQKKQKLSEILKEAKVLQDELVEAGAIPMDDDELDGVAGGRSGGGIGVGAYGPSDSFGLR